MNVDTDTYLRLRSASSSCSYFLRQFSAILAASQPYFVDIPFIRNNIKSAARKVFVSMCTQVIKLSIDR